MGTPTLTPPGWYKDPTGRHDSRYWDSRQWTAEVADGGVTATEGPPTPAPAVVSGYRVIAVPPWRIAALRVATFSLWAAFFFEAVASLALGIEVNNANYLDVPEESVLTWAAWLFHHGGVATVWSYPPLLLWPVLLVAVSLASPLLVQRNLALTKAGTPARFVWSAPQEGARLTGAVRAMGCARTFVKATKTRRARIIGAEIATVVMTAIAGYALVAKEAVFQAADAKFTGELTVGLGPKVCFVLGIIAIVTLPVAWPMRGERPIVVQPDGSVRLDQPTAPPMASGGPPSGSSAELANLPPPLASAP